jgi:hypothetical protein
MLLQHRDEPALRSALHSASGTIVSGEERFLETCRRIERSMRLHGQRHEACQYDRGDLRRVRGRRRRWRSVAALRQLVARGTCRAGPRFVVFAELILQLLPEARLRPVTAAGPVRLAFFRWIRAARAVCVHGRESALRRAGLAAETEQVVRGKLWHVRLAPPLSRYQARGEQIPCQTDLSAWIRSRRVPAA